MKHLIRLSYNSSLQIPHHTLIESLRETLAHLKYLVHQGGHESQGLANRSPEDLNIQMYHTN